MRQQPNDKHDSGKIPISAPEKQALCIMVPCTVLFFGASSLQWRYAEVFLLVSMATPLIVLVLSVWRIRAKASGAQRMFLTRRLVLWMIMALAFGASIVINAVYYMRLR